MQLACDTPLLVVGVHFFDQMRELLLQKRPLDLPRGSNRFALDLGIELTIENAERFDLLDLAERSVRSLDLVCKQSIDRRVGGERTIGGVGDAIGARPFRYGADVELDQWRLILAALVHRSRLADCGT